MGGWREIGGALVAAGALALLVRALSWSAIQDSFVSVGPWFAVIAVIDGLALACDAAAIWSFARPHAEVRYLRCLFAQATGYAVNQVTPGNTIGEPVKIAIVATQTPRTVAVSAVVLYNVATVVVGVIMIAFGTPLALLTLELPPGASLVVGIGSTVIVAVAIALVCAIRRGMCALMIGWLRRLRVIGDQRALVWRDKVASLDDQLRQFGHPSTHRGLAFAAASRVLHAIGTLVLVHAIGLTLGAPLVIALLSLGIAVTWIGNVMPFGIGIADASQYLLYGAFGAAPGIGLAYAMLDRARACAACLLATLISIVCHLSVDTATESRQIPRLIVPRSSHG